jgi:hypothetical protein
LLEEFVLLLGGERFILFDGLLELLLPHEGAGVGQAGFEVLRIFFDGGPAELCGLVGLVVGFEHGSDLRIVLRLALGGI